MKHLRSNYSEQVPLGELFTQDWRGKKARDEALETVASHNENWMHLCRAEAERYIAYSDTFTGEDIRYHCSFKVGLPKHHNAWGALISYLVKRGIIEPTGDYLPMMDDRSHARRTAVYRKKP